MKYTRSSITASGIIHIPHIPQPMPQLQELSCIMLVVFYDLSRIRTRWYEAIQALSSAIEKPEFFNASLNVSASIACEEVICACFFAKSTLTEVTPGTADNLFLTVETQPPQLMPPIW